MRLGLKPSVISYRTSQAVVSALPAQAVPASIAVCLACSNSSSYMGSRPGRRFSGSSPSCTGSKSPCLSRFLNSTMGFLIFVPAMTRMMPSSSLVSLDARIRRRPSWSFGMLEKSGFTVLLMFVMPLLSFVFCIFERDNARRFGGRLIASVLEVPTSLECQFRSRNNWFGV